MTKSEFLSRLKASLNGKVAPAAVAENINYYEDYINGEMRKGRSEEEIFRSLGDPRLIARTIAETSSGSGSGSFQSAEEGENYREYGQQGWYERDSRGSVFGRSAEEGRRKNFRIPGWVWALAAVLFVVLIFSVFFSILSFLMPVILPVLVVIFLVKLFRDWLN